MGYHYTGQVVLPEGVRNEISLARYAVWKVESCMQNSLVGVVAQQLKSSPAWYLSTN